MFNTFSEVIQNLGPDAAVRIARGVRPPGNYLFNSFLPERMEDAYYVESGTMTVKTTMAGLASMDSPYPPGGAIEESTFTEQTLKLAVEATLHEATLRKIQALVMRLRLGGGNTSEALVNEAMNFYQKVVVQAIMDTAEWLRGQALVTGGIDWTFNQKVIDVDYGIPAANLLTNRTGNDRYGGSASKFWTDVFEAQRLLRYNVRAAVLNSTLLNQILANDANNLDLISRAGNTFTVRQFKTGDNGRYADTDPRSLFTFVVYDEEAEILDIANPGQTISTPFMPSGKILFIGNNNASGYRVGQGSTDDPTDSLALGYTHVGPTVEGNGQPGMWGRIYTPEGRPWQLTAQGVENMLPVIENAEKIVVASTDLA
jgi:hypothetical protein